MSYPDSPLADNAQYWLGEAYYVNKSFPEALAAFQRVVDKYPQSRKLPDAMLKIGYCDYELKQWQAARRRAVAGGVEVFRTRPPAIWRSSAWRKWRPRSIEWRQASKSGGTHAGDTVKRERLRINEIFHSLQGEADAVGYPHGVRAADGLSAAMPVLRYRICLSCRRMARHRRHLDRVAGFETPHVCVTGGEPLAQPNCLALARAACAMRAIEVSLETSGALDIAAVDARVSRVVDVKTPGSGEARAQPSREFSPAHAARSGEIRDLLA